MENQISNFKTPKQRGEWVEMRFMARAAEEGLHVSKPWGESTAYDFIVEHASQCFRIQVKSTRMQRDNGFICHVVGSNRTPYLPGAFDFVAVYVLLRDVWFIIPKSHTNAVFLRPGVVKSKNHRYEEAWHLLRGDQVPLTSPPDKLIAEAKSNEDAGSAQH
jgi:hypothetical protein